MKNQPRVSVIIPAYYSHETVASCLNALRGQVFRDFEVIMVNSSPEDVTRQIVTTEFPEVVFVQSSTRLFPHAARNRGVGLSCGELLVFTDPDCRAHPDWLLRLVEAQDAGHQVVGGSMGLASTSWFEQGVHLCKFFWLLNGLTPAQRNILPSANVCYSREVWEEVGPLNGNLFCGDAVLSWRAGAAGYQLWFNPQALVEHQHGGSVLSFWKERFVRGQEFAVARTEFEHWSRGRAAMYIVLFPVLVFVVLMRAGREAYRSGWKAAFLLTLPLQFVGQLGWCLGEALSHWRLAFCSSITRSVHRTVT